jgi:hypothetical protein
LGESDLLQIIKICRLLQGSFLQNGVSQGEEAAARPDFIGICSRCKSSASFQLGGDIVAQLAHVDTGKVKLANLFLERHPGEEIFDPPVGWLIGL